MVLAKTSMREMIRQQICFVPVPASGTIVHCLTGNLLPAETVKSCWVATTIEYLAQTGQIPSAGMCEASSGSTARAAAWACQNLNVRFTAFMPDSAGRRAIEAVEQYGGTVRLTPSSAGMAGAIGAMKKAVELHGFVPLDQFENQRNPQQFAQLIGPRLSPILNPALPVYVAACTGTGGTLVGLVKSLRELDFRVFPVRVYPVRENGDTTSEVFGVVESLPRFVVSQWSGIESVEEMWVRDDQVRTVVKELRELGHLVGPSSGANFHVAARLAARHGASAQYVTVFHDSASRYRL